MSVSFSLAKHLAKPGDKTSDSKYYACTQINDSISLKMFAGLIEKQTTVSRADCTAVLVSAVDNLVTELQRGNQVEFGELGKFRLQLTSTGVDNPADFRSDVNITGANIQYIPGEGVKNKFTDLDYKQVASRALQIAAMKAEKAGAKTINIEEAKKYKKDEAAGDGTDETGKPGSTTGGGTSQGTGSTGENTGGNSQGTGGTGENTGNTGEDSGNGDNVNL